MSSLPVEESSSNDFEQNLISNVTIDESTNELTSPDITHVNIRFTIALAVPAGKFYQSIKT